MAYCYKEVMRLKSGRYEFFGRFMFLFGARPAIKRFSDIVDDQDLTAFARPTDCQ